MTMRTGFWLLVVAAGVLEGATPVPSGVVRVMELQEAGYAYIKP
jgi:intracellular sulfur oxidation DsrE/DsrF family protein